MHLQATMWTLLLGSNAALVKCPKGGLTEAWLLETFDHYFGMNQPDPRRTGVQPGRAPVFFFHQLLHCAPLAPAEVLQRKRYTVASLGGCQITVNQNKTHGCWAVDLWGIFVKKKYIGGCFFGQR